jgi:hypothetical protein
VGTRVRVYRKIWSLISEQESNHHVTLKSIMRKMKGSCDSGWITVPNMNKGSLRIYGELGQRSMLGPRALYIVVGCRCVLVSLLFIIISEDRERKTHCSCCLRVPPPYNARTIACPPRAGLHKTRFLCRGLFHQCLNLPLNKELKYCKKTL